MRTHLRILIATLAVSFGAIACGATAESSDEDDVDGTESGLSAKCKTLSSAVIQPISLGHPFNGSEDFAFDGRESMVAKRGNDVVRVNSTGQVTSTLASLPGQTLGLRYHPNGNLVGAMVNAGKLVSIAPNGQVRDLTTGLNGPNGVYVEMDGTVWFTEGGGNAVVRLTADGKRKAFAAGAGQAQGANGVVVDSANRRLFYTEYDKGKIHRVDLKAQNPSPVDVATISGAGLDGMVLDECGNLYVIDQKHAKLFRVRLNANGAATKAPELVATFPVNVANAQFGSGKGFDPSTLYVGGNPGSVFAVPIGVKGAPVPTPHL